jgi:hypothetical protein
MPQQGLRISFWWGGLWLIIKKPYDAHKKHWTWVRPSDSVVFEISNQILRSGLLPCLFLVFQNQYSCWMCNFAALHIYMTTMCLHMLKLLTKRRQRAIWKRPRAIWNVICKWQCMPLLSLLQLLDLNSIDYNFAKNHDLIGDLQIF